MSYYEKLNTAIIRAVKARPDDVEAYLNYLDMCQEWEKEDFKAAHKANHSFRELISKELQASAERGEFNETEKLDHLLFRSLVMGAPHFFDDYLQAVEYGRPLSKKFYQPRRHYLKPIIEGYQDIADGKLRLLTISMPKRSGKALTMDTLIPTPFGFKKMRDIHVGDLVMAKDGYDTTVTDVFPQGTVDVYDVKFTDGAVVRTCANHLWTVKVHNPNVSHNESGYSTQVLSTGEMLKHGLKSNGKNAHHLYAVEYCQPAEFLYKDVELDPYVLGVLLGDGTFRDNTIMLTNFDKDVTDYVSAHLPAGDEMYCQDAKRGRWIIRSKERRYNEKGYPLPSRTCELLRKMGLMGKLSYEKYIPGEYVFTSSVMRSELLEGLLDTDGYSNDHDIEFSTTSPALRDGIEFIVRSLGGKANHSERMGRYTSKGKVVYTRMNYRIHIQFPAGVSPFKLSRKRDAYKPVREKLYRYVESITYAGKEEAQCICVDNDEHMFLCSDFFVPTHNSQTGINFVNFLSGREPDRSTLMEGTGDDLVRSFYNGMLEYLQLPNEYHYYDIFPNSPLVQTNADIKTINLLHKSRFPTVMCRSIDARQVGLSEATNLLYLDDCVEGREEAKNRVRLDDKWEIISGDILGRAIEGTPIVATGTRYSLYDPIGRLQEEAKKQHWAWRAIEIPALDPKTDESNYEYIRDGKKVFTTAYFREQREMLSAEQFESEFQQQPFEAKGLLFNPKELNYYFELPVDRDPDAIIAACDTADKGADFTSMPVGYIYGDECYIHDVVFDDAPPSVTKPEVAKCIIDNSVSESTFESNNAGTYYARDISNLLKTRGYVCNVRTKRTISNKETRIEFASDNIKKHFYFKDPSTYKRNSQYAEFMRNVTTYTRSGKVEHDDGPDSLAMLENLLRKRVGNGVQIFTRPF